jgi:hypothetical protein
MTVEIPEYQQDPERDIELLPLSDPIFDALFRGPAPADRESGPATQK